MSHQFQSVTQEQWRSGFNRHHCAFCSKDYSDPVHCESSWPLVVVIEDCYVPHAAPYVIEGVSSLDDHSARVTIALFADEAGYNLQWEMN